MGLKENNMLDKKMLDRITNNRRVNIKDSKKKKKKNRRKNEAEELLRESIFANMTYDDESSLGSSYEDCDIYDYIPQKKNTSNNKLVARNEKQKKYMNYLYDQNVSCIFSVGPAGTGKTMICCHVAIQKLKKGEIDKIVITRPAVSVDEDHGFLPGDIEEKMEPWLRPIYDVFYKFYPPHQVKSLIKKQVIEICPLAFMRGRTFDNCWIIADEMQNATQSQMMMLLTRIGADSKIIITGDLNQHDRGFDSNGLKDFMLRYDSYSDEKKEEMNDIQVIKFQDGDIERNPVIKTILGMYKKKI